MKNFSLIVLAAVAVIFGGMYFFQPVVPTPEPVAGAAAGPDVYNRQFFHSDMEVGGNTLATSSQGTAIYTAAQVMENKLIVQTAPGALTVTFPASSTISSWLRNPGDTHTVYITPITTNVTFAGGAGTRLNTASSTKLVNPLGIGSFTFVRKANTDVDIFMSSGI